MSRMITVGAAQLGPIQKAESRTSAVNRMIQLMEQARRKQCDLIVFPELALTTFFPRYLMKDRDEIEQWFERSMPNEVTQPLFDAAREFGMGFHLGYAELVEEQGETRRYNTAILVDKSGTIVGKYRKVHLPGHAEYEDERRFQHLEKYYFDVGNTGFNVWRTMGGVLGMCICNDRRWPETYRVMGLQGVEMVVLGYNTPSTNGKVEQDPHLRMFQSRLCMQSGAYQNSTWVVGVAKAGTEDGHQLFGGTCIVAPTGEIVAQAQGLGDELIVADCDLDLCLEGKENMFNFTAHRRPEYYQLITEQAGAVPPEE
ncbi:N-carbamoyl-D-amino-acid hydrolase [Photobacterium sp. GJ3]|uniref:N-carbamoyl-D-amino-acid hydrolase n=1 Tax=Photobacterium sp. GJ3 TaxID=2829502 RepID=UPI001B8C63E5|nr:N-carbamoyl-D-amino-acid hydrolase [Photobacterium sp. GJ3]QUJ68533.1 N-carbamoyl-D-amino-acid hydrolase [Photobacterium sp. GJ3]